MTSITLHEGDNIESLRALPADSVDSIVTDPPYLLTSINKRFSGKAAAPAKFGKDGAFARASAGFMGQGWDAPNVELPIDPGFAHWFAGFVDGEGCFMVNRSSKAALNCAFYIVVRDDDRDILIECQRQLGGIGTLEFARSNNNPNAGPQARWTLAAKADCQRLRAVLSVFPLRAKKSRDFEIWCHALDAWENHEYGASWEDMEFYRDQLMLVRKFGSLYKPDFHFHYRWCREVFRVLKPGGYIVAFSGARTGHWQACAMEMAGFIMHPFLGWVFGQGFPKAHNAAMAIDKALGVQQGFVPEGDPVKRMIPGADQHATGDWTKTDERQYQPGKRVPGSEEAAQWDGWAYGGQALKPALEPIYVGQKPFSEKNGALNLLKHGVGAINIDGCRVNPGEFVPGGGKSKRGGSAGGSQVYGAGESAGNARPHTLGRHPANLLHDGSDDVIGLFPESSGSGAARKLKRGQKDRDDGWGMDTGGASATELRDAGSGSAARFFNSFPLDADPIFYQGKANKADRAGSKHPTVKPVALMQWLVRLVTPVGGVTLDPFAGSGTTGEAARREGFDCILMEAEEQFIGDIRRRFGLPGPVADFDDFDALLEDDFSDLL